MVFVVIASEPGRRKDMTTLLLSTFPGSTVFQHDSVMRALSSVLHQRIDALFAVNENDEDDRMIEQLQIQKPELPVILLSVLEEIGYGRLPEADVAQKLRSTLLTDRTATSHLPT